MKEIDKNKFLEINSFLKNFQENYIDSNQYFSNAFKKAAISRSNN